MTERPAPILQTLTANITYQSLVSRIQTSLTPANMVLAHIHTAGATTLRLPLLPSARPATPAFARRNLQLARAETERQGANVVTKDRTVSCGLLARGYTCLRFKRRGPLVVCHSNIRLRSALCNWSRAGPLRTGLINEPVNAFAPLQATHMRSYLAELACTDKSGSVKGAKHRARQHLERERRGAGQYRRAAATGLL